MAHNEFLLDRMAANYVSYTLVEDPGIGQETKEMFLNTNLEFVVNSWFSTTLSSFKSPRAKSLILMPTMLDFLWCNPFPVLSDDVLSFVILIIVGFSMLIKKQ